MCSTALLVGGAEAQADKLAERDRETAPRLRLWWRAVRRLELDFMVWPNAVQALTVTPEPGHDRNRRHGAFGSRPVPGTWALPSCTCSSRAPAAAWPESTRCRPTDARGRRPGRASAGPGAAPCVLDATPGTETLVVVAWLPGAAPEGLADKLGSVARWDEPGQGQAVLASLTDLEALVADRVEFRQRVAGMRGNLQIYRRDIPELSADLSSGQSRAFQPQGLEGTAVVVKTVRIEQR